MATWQGWQAQLLTAASLPTAEATQEFLFDWSQHAASDCQNNPVDISHVLGTRRDCHKLTATRTAQNYTTHGNAATAFKDEIHSRNFPHLLAALKVADPYQEPNPSSVAADLRVWGSPAFATYYLSHSNVGTGAGGDGGSGAIPHAHKGWEDLRKSVNHKLPGSLKQSDRNVAAALRSLGRGRKVKA